MKVAIETSSISCRLLGRLLMGVGACFVVRSVRARAARVAPIAGLLLVIGYVVERSRGYIITHPHAGVARQLIATLGLLHLSHEQRGATILVRKTRTVIQLRGVGPVTLLRLRFREPGSERERYLAATLIKYQRYV